MQDNENAQKGITRREALRKGSLAGLGMVWVTPVVTSIEMSPELAQATSPVPDTTTPEVESGTVVDETPPEDEPDTTTPEVESGTVVDETPREDEPEDEVGSDDEVLADSLPFTGLPLEQLLPLAGGAVATGAAAVRAAREKKTSDSQQDPEAES